MIVQSIDNHPIATAGKLVRIAAIRDEPYECLDDPEGFIGRLKGQGFPADLFTFLLEISEPTPRYAFHQEWHRLAVVPVTSYENWWKKQIKDTARNKIRKARKNGVNFRAIEFNDDFVWRVMEIYNESPLRQGKPFEHYGKDFDTIKRELSTFFKSSTFVGAFLKDDMVGFIKFVRGKNVASLMHIISKIGHRNMAPTNGLIAEAVKMCAEERISFLHYGVWSRRGLGDFKKQHGFVCHNVPRYFVPLTIKGRLILRLHFHRKLRDYLPERVIDNMVALRTKWNSVRFRSMVAARENAGSRLPS